MRRHFSQFVTIHHSTCVQTVPCTLHSFSNTPPRVHCTCRTHTYITAPKFIPISVAQHSLGAFGQFPRNPPRHRPQDQSLQSQNLKVRFHITITITITIAVSALASYLHPVRSGADRPGAECKSDEEKLDEGFIFLSRWREIVWSMSSRHHHSKPAPQ